MSINSVDLFATEYTDNGEFNEWSSTTSSETDQQSIVQDILPDFNGSSIGDDWEFSDRFIAAMQTDENLEESIISAMRRVTRYLDSRGYNDKTLRAEISETPEDPLSQEYLLRVTLNISDVDEWIETEDVVQELTAESEVEDAKIYSIVDRYRQ